MQRNRRCTQVEILQNSVVFPFVYTPEYYGEERCVDALDRLDHSISGHSISLGVTPDEELKVTASRKYYGPRVHSKTDLFTYSYISFLFFFSIGNSSS